VVVMDAGKIVEMGPPDHLRRGAAARVASTLWWMMPGWGSEAQRCCRGRTSWSQFVPASACAPTRALHSLALATAFLLLPAPLLPCLPGDTQFARMLRAQSLLAAGSAGHSVTTSHGSSPPRRSPPRLQLAPAAPTSDGTAAPLAEPPSWGREGAAPPQAVKALRFFWDDAMQAQLPSGGFMVGGASPLAGKAPKGFFWDETPRASAAPPCVELAPPAGMDDADVDPAPDGVREAEGVLEGAPNAALWAA
jgi:hypothetical protein